jgi:hypothetical protein
MFTGHFNDKQKAVFLGLLIKLVEADGKVSDVERDKLREYDETHGSVKPEEAAPEDLIEIFPTRKDRASVMLELLAVGMAKSMDYSCCREDDAFLRTLAKNLSISDLDLGWMSMWAPQLLFLLSQTGKVMDD